MSNQLLIFLQIKGARNGRPKSTKRGPGIIPERGGIDRRDNFPQAGIKSGLGSLIGCPGLKAGAFREPWGAGDATGNVLSSQDLSPRQVLTGGEFPIKFSKES